jgi:hypothetical protein
VQSRSSVHSNRRYPFRTGMGTVSDQSPYQLPGSEVLIPRLLKNGFRGSPYLGLPYKCGAFGSGT